MSHYQITDDCISITTEPAYTSILGWTFTALPALVFVNATINFSDLPLGLYLFIAPLLLGMTFLLSSLLFYRNRLVIGRQAISESKYVLHRWKHNQLDITGIDRICIHFHISQSNSRSSKSELLPVFVCNRQGIIQYGEELSLLGLASSQDFPTWDAFFDFVDQLSQLTGKEITASKDCPKFVFERFPQDSKWR